MYNAWKHRYPTQLVSAETSSGAMFFFEMGKLAANANVRNIVSRTETRYLYSLLRPLY